MYVCMCVYMYICNYVCIYMCMYVYMYLRVFVTSEIGNTRNAEGSINVLASLRLPPSGPVPLRGFGAAVTYCPRHGVAGTSSITSLQPVPDLKEHFNHLLSITTRSRPTG
jgi:hypothetical protein